MNDLLRDVLRERAEVDPPRLDATAIIREGDRRTRRHRRRTAACLAGLATVVGVVSLVAPRFPDAAPEPPAATVPAPATLLETLPDGRIPPGRYSMGFPGADAGAPVAQVDVPQGFKTYNGNVLWAAGRGTGGLMVWTVARLPADPCRAGVRSFVEPGPSVEDLADALRAQVGRRSRPPQPVSFQGHDGLYLEFHVPADLDAESCVGGFYDTWTAISGLRRFQTPPGSRDRIWILEVDGERLLINLVQVPGNVANDRLDAVFDSLTLVDDD